MKLETVVAGLDLGPTTARVAAFANQLAKRLGATLVHLHAEDDVVGPEWAELAVEAQRRRREAVAQHSAPGEAEIVWRPGTAAAALQSEAQARRGGLVVAGTGAERETPELGTTAIRLLRSLTVPLCLVPTHAEAHTTLTRGHILAPVDFSPESEHALRLVLKLSQRLAGEGEPAVTVLTVVQPPGLVAHLGPQEGPRLPALLRAELEKATTLMHELTQRVGLGHAELVVVEADDVAAAIRDHAHDFDSDLIVLPSHAKGAIERLFAGSTTEKLARQSDRPLLILPPTWLT